MDTTTSTTRNGTIIEESDRFVRVTLPEWLTPEERRQIRDRLDSLFLPESRESSSDDGEAQR